MSRVYEGIGPRWAAYNERGEGRDRGNGKRVGYNGRFFYSYNTVVARYHTNPDGQKYVLLTTTHYSSSTSSHLAHARSSAKVPKFWVPSIDGDHEENLTWFTQCLTDLAAQCVKSWKSLGWYYSDERWKDTLNDKWDNMRRYRDITMTKFELPLIQEIIAEVAAGREAKRVAYEDPKAVRRRERNEARYQAKKALKLVR